jgi:hypothetical protein
MQIMEENMSLMDVFTFLHLGDYSEKIASTSVLSIFCFVFGFLIVFLDRLYHKFYNISFLKIQYKQKAIENIMIMFCWALASGIVGMIGGLIEIFSTKGTIQSSIFVAIAWPVVINNLTENIKRNMQSNTGTGN